MWDEYGAERRDTKNDSSVAIANIPNRIDTYMSILSYIGASLEVFPIQSPLRNSGREVAPALGQVPGLAYIIKRLSSVLTLALELMEGAWSSLEEAVHNENITIPRPQDSPGRDMICPSTYM